MFRFTIRDLLLFTVIVALGVGWWIDRSRLAAKFNETFAAKSAANAESLLWEYRANYLAESLRGMGWKIDFHEGRSGVDSVVEPNQRESNP